MQTSTRNLLRAALAGACWLSIAASQAQSAPPVRPQSGEDKGPQAGDPARWYQEDKTSAEQLRTLRKEIAAAQQEELKTCAAGPAHERKNCVAAARATYQQDMARANQQSAAAHPR